MRVVVRGEIVQRIHNLLPRVPIRDDRIGLAPQLQASIMVGPVSVLRSQHPPFVALAAIPLPLAIRVLIIPGTVFAHCRVPSCKPHSAVPQSRRKYRQRVGRIVKYSHRSAMRFANRWELPNRTYQ